jgi:plastocyanin
MRIAHLFGLIALCSLLLGAGSRPLHAEDVTELRLALRDHKFEPSEIKAAAGTAIVITITNNDPTPEEFESTALKVEKIVVPNSEIKVRLRALKPGRYEFFGEYNPASAKGVLVVE